MFFCLVCGYKNQNGDFLRLNKDFVSCSFLSFMAQKPTLEVFMVLQDLCFWILFMVLISNKVRTVDETWWDICSFCFIYSYKIHNKVWITKTALRKLLESTLNESSNLKNMSDERLGCPMKSLLSYNFYWTMSDLLKTLISHSASYINLSDVFHLYCRVWNNRTGTII